MAQDFRAAFGLGNTDTGIATLDTGGVVLSLPDPPPLLLAQSTMVSADLHVAQESYPLLIPDSRF
jgi:hypothetical protein